MLVDIVDRLSNWKHASFRRDGSTLETMREAADEITSLRAELEKAKKDGWISVKDRLPEIRKDAKDFQLSSGESEIVFIVLDGYPCTGTYHVNIEEWSIPFHHGRWNPSHWMPYTPPKE